VPRWPGRVDATTAQPAVLQPVVGVEHDHRRDRQRRGAAPVDGPRVAEPPGRERGRGHRPVPHDAERFDRAPLDGDRLRRHRAHHGPVAQQLGRAVLVLAVHAQRETVRERCERGQDPRGQRVAVDRERDLRDRAVARQVAGGVGRERVELAGQPDERLTGRRGAHGAVAAQQDRAGGLLERLDALADGRRGHVQGARGGVERAEVGGGRERAQLAEVPVGHAATLRLHAEHSLS